MLAAAPTSPILPVASFSKLAISPNRATLPFAFRTPARSRSFPPLSSRTPSTCNTSSRFNSSVAIAGAPMDSQSETPNTTESAGVSQKSGSSSAGVGADAEEFQHYPQQLFQSDSASSKSTPAGQKIVIVNNHGEKLVGILRDSDTKELIILCHGFRSSKETRVIRNIAYALTAEEFGIFCFDFSGNGESEGSFQYGNYLKEVDDLRAVIQHFSVLKYKIRAIVGHSKGGNVVLLYGSMYHDVPIVINVSGRFALERGIEERLGKDFIQRIKKDGYIDVKDKLGQFEYRVTEDSLMERLNIKMHSACLSFDKECKVLTLHGSADEIIPVEDAKEIAKLIPNHKLHIIEGADHGYTWHQNELTSALLEFLRFNLGHEEDKQARI